MTGVCVAGDAVPVVTFSAMVELWTFGFIVQQLFVRRLSDFGGRDPLRFLRGCGLDL